MTIIGPLLMGAMIVVPAWLTMQGEGRQDIVVVDETGQFRGFLASSDDVKFFYEPSPRLNEVQGAQRDSIFATALKEAKKEMVAGKYSAVLHIFPGTIEKKHNPVLIYKKQLGLSTKSYIQRVVQDNLEDLVLLRKGLNVQALKLTKQQAKITVLTEKIGSDGKATKDNAEISVVAGYAAGFLIYLFIFLYGAQVLRGVIEEKVSRIVEVIISSVRPFQLMMGKIIGIAFVGLTQFLLWVTLTGTLVIGASTLIAEKAPKPVKTTPTMEELMGGNKSLGPSSPMQQISEDEIGSMFSAGFGTIASRLPLILATFLFYFIGGYLLYGSLFAAVGAAVDSEADTQQFMLPITIPLIFSIIMANFVVNNPEGPLAIILSIIPFTAPVIMMVRIPFGMEGHWWELGLSMGMLVLGFIFTTWLAARIYRVGILMYGKKPTYRELGKWLFYRG